MPANYVVRMDRRAIERYMTNIDKPPMRRAMVVGERIKTAARAEIHSQFPREFLAIVKRPGRDSTSGYVDVGSPRTHTKPHDIVGNPLLAFHWRKVGRFVVVRRVHHPGSDFVPFLRRILTKALAAQRGRI